MRARQNVWHTEEKRMPEDDTELVIEGGNHAWFAYYGEQDGEGTASITKEEQQKKTAAAIVEMITAE